MLELGVAVEGDAVVGDPMPHAHPDGGDLVLAPVRLRHPDADPARAPLASDTQAGEGADHPFLEGLDVAAQVAAAAGEIEHDIGDALARAVIGELAAAPAAMDRKAALLDEILGLGTRAGRDEGWMLEEPDELRRPSGPDGRNARLHRSYRLLVSDRRLSALPLDAACCGGGEAFLETAHLAWFLSALRPWRGRGSVLDLALAICYSPSLGKASTPRSRRRSAGMSSLHAVVAEW